MNHPFSFIMAILAIIGSFLSSDKKSWDFWLALWVKSSLKILGIKVTRHDTGVCIIHNDKIIAISEERLNQIIKRTRDGGAEIIKLLERGSAFYAPAASGVEMAECYLKDKKKLLPCAAYLNGEYGVKNMYAGVPVIIGRNGVEKIQELSLNGEEKKELEKSVSAVNKLWLSAFKNYPELR
mgnify:CR=1 FL=1